MFAKTVFGLLLTMGLSLPALSSSTRIDSFNSTQPEEAVEATSLDFVSIPYDAMHYAFTQIPNAVAQAVTTDFVVVSTLAMMNAGFPVLGLNIPLAIIPAYTAAAALKHVIQSTCNHMIGEPSVFCGLIGGAAKHSSRSYAVGTDLPLAIKGIEGAIDGSNYAIDSKNLGELKSKWNAEKFVKNVSEKNTSEAWDQLSSIGKVLAIVTTNEAFNSFLDIGIRALRGQKILLERPGSGTLVGGTLVFAAVRLGKSSVNAYRPSLLAIALAPLLLTTTLYTTNAYLAEPIRDGIISASKDLNIHQLISPFYNSAMGLPELLSSGLSATQVATSAHIIEPGQALFSSLINHLSNLMNYTYSSPYPADVKFPLNPEF